MQSVAQRLKHAETDISYSFMRIAKWYRAAPKASPELSADAQKLRAQKVPLSGRLASLKDSQKLEWVWSVSDRLGLSSDGERILQWLVCFGEQEAIRLAQDHVGHAGMFFDSQKRTRGQPVNAGEESAVYGAARARRKFEGHFNESPGEEADIWSAPAGNGKKPRS